MLNGELCFSNDEGVLLIIKVAVVTQSSQNDIWTLEWKYKALATLRKLFSIIRSEELDGNTKLSLNHSEKLFHINRSFRFVFK